LVDAALGDGSAAIGSGYGPGRASDLRSRKPLCPPLVRSDDLPAINFLILDQIPRGSLLIGDSRIECFIERRLLSGGAILIGTATISSYSLLPQRNGRVESRCSPRGQSRCNGGNDQKERHHGCKSSRVVRFDADEHAGVVSLFLKNHTLRLLGLELS
jgi:hypothetical protein